MTPKKKTGTSGGTSEKDKIDPRAAGNLIKLIRTKDLRIKQHQLATRLEVDPTTVSNWERGAYAPSRDIILRIAGWVSPNFALDLWRLAGVDVDRLRMGYGSPSSNDGTVEIDLLDADNALKEGPKAKEVVPRSWLGDWCMGLSVEDAEKKTSSAFCAIRVRSPISLFPFASGDIAVIERSTPRISALLGRPVAIHFARFPEVLTPSGAEGSFELKAIQVGWLAIDRPDQPDFSINTPQAEAPSSHSREELSYMEPWRLILRGASVQGIARRSSWPGIPITEWKSDRKADVKEFAAGLRDVPFNFRPHIQILGPVICWKRVATYGDLVLNVASKNR
jgi:transcriptional regulator with XRE-family HTH domain